VDRRLSEKMVRPGRSEAAFETSSISDIVRLALSGDAGQRALAAWHIGWQPALETSRTNWVIPVLEELLDDPYAAVRCLAERSLKSVSSLTSTNYDFTINPAARKPFGKGIPAAFAGEGTLPIGLDENTYKNLLRVRDVHPVRLRE